MIIVKTCFEPRPKEEFLVSEPVLTVCYGKTTYGHFEIILKIVKVESCKLGIPKSKDWSLSNKVSLLKYPESEI